MLRVGLCMVLSYLWQHCVLETAQVVGTKHPAWECDQKYTCFASKLQFITFMTRQYTTVDCADPKDFDSSVVISCLRFVEPSMQNSLMHMAIAHSLMQLSLKTYEAGLALRAIMME